MQPVSQIIRRRYSCRSYVERPIAAQTRQRLIDFAASLPTGPFGNQVRFQLAAASAEDRRALKDLGTYGFIKGASGFIIGAVGAGERNLEDFGYLMERVILYATELDLGTCWLGGTFTKSSFAEKISPRPGELIPAVAAVGYNAEKPRWFETLIRQRAGADRRLPWARLFLDGGFDVPLERDAAGDYATPLEMVRLAPSASNKQPWRIVKDGERWHFYLQRTPGYRERMLVRLFTVADMQRIDMGIAMCHFELAARELGLEGGWLSHEPGIQTPGELTEYMVSWVG